MRRDFFKCFTAEQIIQQTLANKSVNNQATIFTVYQCKQNKNVCILSTLHTSVMVDTTTKKKPEAVTFYNRTKCGVGIADQMARQHMVKASTGRWLVAVFFNILYLACINAYMLYKKKTEDAIS